MHEKHLIPLHAVGIVHNSRTEIVDDRWGDVLSTITLFDSVYDPSATDGLKDFSHLEVIFYMDKINPEKIVTTTRHPRNNQALPKVGILAQRGKNRPNQIGTSFAKIVAVNELNVTVMGLDAIDGTPILDLKPCIQQFLPRESVHEPAWTKEIMNNYYETTDKK